MKNPKISVIVPVYNAESTIRRCVDSILAQTYTDFECLLIDDGSKDLSRAICDEYAEKDSRVRVFHKENGGVSSARNVGLDNMRGEWVTFVDSDDYLQSGFLESLAFFSDSDLVIGNCIWVNDNEEKLLVNDIPSGIFTKEVILPKYLYGVEFNVPWGKLFKSSVIATKDIRFKMDMRVAEDLCFVYQYLIHIKGLRRSFGLSPNSGIVHYAPGNFLEKYSMSTEEAARHFTVIWETYKRLNIRCETFENKMLSDIFELCKRDTYNNPSPWYENEAVKEAYNKRAELSGTYSHMKVFLVFKMKFYKFKSLCRKPQ